MQPNIVDIYGAPLHAITERECVQLIIGEHRAGHGGWVATHNLDHLRRLACDAAFARLCQTAQLRVADGMPLVWASWLQGGPTLPERVAGSSLIYSLTSAAAEAGCSVFYLGGNEGTAAATARILSQQYGKLKVAGFDCPPFGFEKDAAYMRMLENHLTAAAPDIVFVALGSPKQEELIGRLCTLLPEAWFLGVGVSFSFVSREIRRAPRWMQNAGLEWLHRFIQEPLRLGRRYLINGMQTAAQLFAHCLARRCFHRQPAEQMQKMPNLFTEKPAAFVELLGSDLAADETLEHVGEFP